MGGGGRLDCPGSGNCFYFGGVGNAMSCIFDTFYDNLKVTDLVYFMS